MQYFTDTTVLVFKYSSIAQKINCIDIKRVSTQRAVNAITKAQSCLILAVYLNSKVVQLQYSH